MPPPKLEELENTVETPSQQLADTAATDTNQNVTSPVSTSEDIDQTWSSRAMYELGRSKLEPIITIDQTPVNAVPRYLSPGNGRKGGKTLS